MASTIPGYDYGTRRLAPSPFTLTDLELLKKTVLFSDDDIASLHKAGEILESQIEAVLDVWYGFVGAHPHLLEHFLDSAGTPIASYLQAVRLRFGQWIRDTCRAEYDQRWLDYQHEIARRHTSAAKNRTDNAPARTAHIPLRYLIAFIYPLTATIRPFLASKGHSAAEVDAMQQAWFKAVTLQTALWSRAYAE